MPGKTISSLALMLTAAVATAQPATAQPQKTTIAAPADQPYRFKHSGITIPATLEGLPRRAIEQYGAAELDVFANYERGAEAITIYVYRNVAGAVPVWFDRAVAPIETRRDAYGTVAAVAPPTAFTPPGQTVTSGLIGAWSVTRAPYRSTALALMPVGEWLVKVRYSSGALDAAALAARFPALLAAMTWPTGLAPAAPAQPIAACATPLSYPKKAKIVRGENVNFMTGIMNGIIQSVRSQVDAAPTSTGTAPAAKPPLWCRDPGKSPVGAVYRADASTDSYLLAFSDAGRGALVSPDPTGLLMDKNAAARWAVAMVDLGQTMNYPPLSALPRPTDVIAVLRQPAVSVSTTWGGSPQVTINSGAIKGNR